MISRFLAAIAFLFVISEAAAESRLTVYTSQPKSDAAETVGGFMRQHPGIVVDWRRSGTTVIVEQFEQERAAGEATADILFIASAMTMNRLKAAGALEAHPAADVSRMPTGAYDPEGFWFGTKLIAIGIGRHTGRTVPIDALADLADPRIAPRVALPTPLYSGSAAYLLATLTQAPDFGWRFYERLAAGDAVSVRGNGRVLWALATGRADYGIIVDFLAIGAATDGAKIAYVAPKDAFVAITEPVGIVAGTENRAAARLFVDYLLSAKGAALAASQGYAPVRTDSPRPSGFPPQEAPLIAPDLNRAVAEDAANKRRFRALFGEPAHDDDGRGG